MYSNNRSVQILISLLKAHGISEVVLSPGGSDAPIIHSIENDGYFTCHSVVDERSAAYYALGITLTKNCAVACICTSGTAVANYLPAMTEAYYQNAPVLAITADKHPYFQGQLEIQKIEQKGIFGGVVKKSVELPFIRDREDEWLCNRLINEAILALDHHGTGPSHINIPITGNYNVYDCTELPKERVIRRYELTAPAEVWQGFAKKLHETKRIMVVVGQNVNFTETDIGTLNAFFQKFNCFFAVEHLSNLKCDGCVYTYPTTEMAGITFTPKLLPDLVISIGNNLSAYQLKPAIRSHYEKTENWLVSESGEIRDAYKCLNTIFECDVMTFFNKMLEHSSLDSKNDLDYYKEWKSTESAVSTPDFPFSNFYVAQKLAQIIPENSILHTAILSSTRVMQFFELADGVKSFSNVGALGIDGCLSTFAGAAASTEELAFLVIGDLSFFYDMNAAGIRSIGPNVRIILLNNGGGSEFHFFLGRDRVPTIDTHITVKHDHIAAGWITSLDYEYYSATTKEKFDSVIDKFGKHSGVPMFLEVITNMEDDGVQARKMYDKNLVIPRSSKVKGLLKKFMTDKQVQRIKNVMKAINK